MRLSPRHDAIFRPLAFITFACCIASAQVISNIPGNYTDWPVFITIGQKTGSGFLMRASNSVYLVTARHVLFDDTGPVTNWHLWSTQAVVNAYRTFGTNSDPEPISLTLNCQKLWDQLDLRTDLRHDVALVRFEDCDPAEPTHVTSHTNTVSFTTAQHSLLPVELVNVVRFKDIKVGSDVIGFGFPNSIGLDEAPQLDRSLPLLRKGIVAGVNKGLGTVILDLPVYQGDSGGPVILREQNGISYRWYFIGVQTQWIPFRDIWQNVRFKYLTENRLNSGYSVVEPMDAVLDMVWK